MKKVKQVKSHLQLEEGDKLVLTNESKLYEWNYNKDQLRTMRYQIGEIINIDSVYFTIAYKNDYGVRVGRNEMVAFSVIDLENEGGKRK